MCKYIERARRLPVFGEQALNTPDWLKPGLYGAAVGAIALAVVGFSWGGWTTGSTAQKMAADTARQEVLAALVPICLEQSQQDPGRATVIAELRDARSYERGTLVMDAGWATMPGASEPDRAVARACMDQLAAQF